MGGMLLLYHQQPALQIKYDKKEEIKKAKAIHLTALSYLPEEKIFSRLQKQA